MKKAITLVITGAILLLFIFIMNSGGIMKKSFSNSDDVIKILKELEKDIEESNWVKGLEDLEKLQSAWKIVERRVQFSVERNDLEGIGLSIARLKGSIRGKNQYESLIGWEELNAYWHHLEK